MDDEILMSDGLKLVLQIIFSGALVIINNIFNKYISKYGNNCVFLEWYKISIEYNKDH